MVPTKERNQSAVFISYGSEGILIDCGEGTQRQLKQAGISLAKITKILITHWHGDHVLGLPGVIQSLSASDYNGELRVYGPKGTLAHFEAMFGAFVFDRKIKMSVKEIESGVFFENKEFCLSSLPLEHGITTLGYVFAEKEKRKIDTCKIKKLGIPLGPLLGKLQDNIEVVFKGKKIAPKEATYVVRGKKVALIADTLPCNNCYEIANGADLLICESTYSSKLSGKGEEYGHMTSRQAAEIANRCNVKKLVLTHFSARYKNTHELEEDARGLFDAVICAEDFMKIDV